MTNGGQVETPQIHGTIANETVIEAVQEARRWLAANPKRTAVEAAYWVSAATNTPRTARLEPRQINELFHAVQEQLTGKQAHTIDYGGEAWKALLNRIGGESSTGLVE